jgi:hypothetical protein
MNNQSSFCESIEVEKFRKLSSRLGTIHGHRLNGNTIPTSTSHDLLSQPHQPSPPSPTSRSLPPILDDRQPSDVHFPCLTSVPCLSLWFPPAREKGTTPLRRCAGSVVLSSFQPTTSPEPALGCKCGLPRVTFRGWAANVEHPSQSHGGVVAMYDLPRAPRKSFSYSQSLSGFREQPPIWEGNPSLHFWSFYVRTASRGSRLYYLICLPKTRWNSFEVCLFCRINLDTR